MIGLSFLYFFLPLFTALYCLLPKPLKSRLSVIAAAGLICWVDPIGMIPMAVSVLSGYLFGIFIFNFREKPVSKLLLGVEVALNVAVFLLFHKTAYDGAELLTLLGQSSIIRNVISVGTAIMPMHSIAYCVDIYRKKYRCEHRFIKVAQYIAFFPVFIAGPVLRFDKLSPQLDDPKVSVEKCASGIRLIMLGLFMKLFISNTMLDLWNDVRDIPIVTMPALSAWIGMLAFAFFVYFEVNAFSNIAAGLSSLLGFDTPRNFREPYKSHSFMDFCRKFNCTLYQWCMDYVYRSIRKKGGREIFEFLAIILTVMAGCIWYGSALRSVIFGAALIVMLCLEKLFEKPLKKLPKLLRTLLFVGILLVIMPFMAFSAPMEAVKYIGAMFGMGHAAVDTTSEYLIGTYLLLVVLCVLISSGVFGYFFKRKMFNNEYLQTIIQPVWVIALLIFCTAFLISGNDSLYTFMF